MMYIYDPPVTLDKHTLVNKLFWGHFQNATNQRSFNFQAALSEVSWQTVSAYMCN